MTAGLDERRPDHTRPTIAFIVLAVAAAGVMTAGMTGNQRDLPVAADRPVQVVPEVPDPVARPSVPPAPPDFSIADVVTLAAGPATTARKRPKAPQTSGDGAGSAGTVAEDAVPDATSGGTSGGSGGGAATGSVRSGGGSGSGTGGSGSTSGGSTGSGGGTASGGSGGSDTPGRSGTSQSKARGQQDTAPGRAGGKRSAERDRGRR